MTDPIPTEYDALKTSAANLQHMLEETDPRLAPWSEEDYGDILRHQLSVPVDAEHVGLPIATPAHSLAALLRDARPNPDTLQAVKEYAKMLRNDRDSGFPGPVATVIYFAAIMAAQRRAGKKISELDSTQLREGCAWVLAQTWVPDDLRALFENEEDE